MTSFGSSEEAETTLQLILVGETEPTYEIKVVGTGAQNYSFSNLQVGRYTFRIIKDKHCTSEYVIIIVDTDVIQNVDAWLCGDVNSDGIVDNLDRMVLSRYLADWAEYMEDIINMEAADVNKDGVVDNLDRMVLSRHLADWEGYEELPLNSIE